MGYVNFSYDQLDKFVTDAFVKFGFSDSDAKIIKDVLLMSDLYGIESHGMQRLVRYHKGIEKGTIYCFPVTIYGFPVTDRKGLNEAELAKKPAIHPYNANKKIASIATVDRVFLVDDTFEHVLWDQEQNESVKSTDKPFNSWKRIRGYIDGTQDLSEKCKSTLKEIIVFAFC